MHEVSMKVYHLNVQTRSYKAEKLYSSVDQVKPFSQA